MATLHPIARYIPLLIAGDEQGLRDLFTGAPRVNDPLIGWVEDARFEEFVSSSHRGLRERGARVEHVATTSSESGATEECVLSLVRLGVAVALPVAIASDTSPDALLDAIRIYHTMEPLLGFHLVRSPILPEQFAPGGELRESRGAAGLHRGVDALRAFFTVVFSNGGGLGLEHCTVNDAGASCALEYVVTAWGRSAVPHQGAAAVFERSDAGLLSAVRMYDDVEHPFTRN